MRKNFRAPLFGALCGAFLFAATAPGSAAPLSVASPNEDGVSASLLLQLARYNAPAGKKCLKWTRRWSPSLGFGRRRCVHWR